jgi:chitodextrinase
MQKHSGLDSFVIATILCAIAVLGLVRTEAAAGANTTTFVSVADAHVTSARPRKNFGAAPELRVDRSPATRSYLAFNVRGLGGTISRAFLFIYAKNGAPGGFDVRRVRGRPWSESRVTYANAPDASGVVASQRRFRSARWTRVDVTRFVPDDGLVSFAVTTSSRSLLRLASSESARTPQLVVETDNAAPTVSITSPPGGSVFTSSQTVTVGASATDDLRIRKVEFYNGGALMRTDKSKPFTTAWLIDGGDNGMHTWTAKAYDAAGKSAVSAAVDLHVDIDETGSPDTTAPTPPSGLAASATETSVALSWNAASDNIGVAGYRVYINGVLAASTGSTGHTATGLACGTSYVFGIRAYDSAGNVSPEASLTSSTSSCPVSIGTTYFVDSVSGNDANAGTSSAAPWKTLAKANAAPLAPGDRLVFKRGGAWTGSLRVATSGNAGAPITIGAYGSGVLPVVQGASSCIVLAGSYLVLKEVRANGCGWAGIDVTGGSNRVEYAASTNNVTGIHVRAGAIGNVLLRNEFVGNNKMSVLTSSPTNDDSGAFGISLHGDNTEIAYNTITGSDAFSYDFGRDGSAVEVYGGRNNHIHHNLAIDNHDFTELGNSRAADNTFSENVVRSSLATSSFLVTRGAASGDGPILRTKVYNNTIVLTGPSSQGFVCYAGCNADILRMRNNVIQAVWKVGYADAAFDEDNDLFFGGAVQFAKGPNSIAANPQFVDPAASDFRLKSTSPAVDKGVDTGQLLDFAGQVIPVDGNGDGVARPDIGAYEYH